jgi:hypothetical protein
LVALLCFCFVGFWSAVLETGTGTVLSVLVGGVALCLCILPCCVHSGYEPRRHVPVSTRRHSRPVRLRPSRAGHLPSDATDTSTSLNPSTGVLRPRIGLRGGFLCHGLAAAVCVLGALSCIQSGEGGDNDHSLAMAVHEHFGELCPLDCQLNEVEAIEVNCQPTPPPPTAATLSNSTDTAALNSLAAPVAQPLLERELSPCEMQVSQPSTTSIKAQ